MKYIWLFFGWFFALLFGFLKVSMLMTKNWLAALVLLFVALLCLPPISSLIGKFFNKKIYPWLKIVAIAVLLFLFGRILTGGDVTSIYNSPDIQARFIEIYDEKMSEWPVQYEDVFLDTRYGNVHVIVSGLEETPPMLLLHASGVAGWSWKYNVEELSKNYRTFAIDLIGDAGKSEFATLDNVMKTGKDQAALYTEIMDKLGLDKVFVVGASEGGFIATNLALYAPERVQKLALLGPMGYSGAVQSIIRITIAQMFPLKSIHKSTFSWAFSNNPMLEEEFSEWFPLLMKGIYPRKVAPLPISAEQRQSISVPVLFVFGERDNLVGDPEKAKALVQDIPDVRVKIVAAGHLMGAELPDEVNAYILDFFAGEQVYR